MSVCHICYLTVSYFICQFVTFVTSVMSLLFMSCQFVTNWYHCQLFHISVFTSVVSLSGISYVSLSNLLCNCQAFHMLVCQFCHASCCYIIYRMVTYVMALFHCQLPYSLLVLLFPFFVFNWYRWCGSILLFCLSILKLKNCLYSANNENHI